MGEPFRFGLGCRKIYECGKGTAVISVPRAWMMNNEVGAGDTVPVEVMHNGDLVIRAPKK